MLKNPHYSTRTSLGEQAKDVGIISTIVGCIVGAIFIGVGQTQRCGIISILLRRQIEVSDYIQALMSNNLSFMDVLPLLRRFGDKFTEPEYKELMDTGL